MRILAACSAMLKVRVHGIKLTSSTYRNGLHVRAACPTGSHPNMRRSYDTPATSVDERSPSAKSPVRVHDMPCWHWRATLLPAKLRLTRLSCCTPVCGGCPRLLTDKEDDNGYEQYQIGLWGDVPYSDWQAQTGVPNLIKHMNSFPLKFSVVSSAGPW